MQASTARIRVFHWLCLALKRVTAERHQPHGGADRAPRGQHRITRRKLPKRHAAARWHVARMESARKRAPPCMRSAQKDAKHARRPSGLHNHPMRAPWPQRGQGGRAPSPARLQTDAPTPCTKPRSTRQRARRMPIGIAGETAPHAMAARGRRLHLMWVVLPTKTERRHRLALPAERPAPPMSAGAHLRRRTGPRPTRRHRRNGIRPEAGQITRAAIGSTGAAIAFSSIPQVFHEGCNARCGHLARLV